MTAAVMYIDEQPREPSLAQLERELSEAQRDQRRARENADLDALVKANAKVVDVQKRIDAKQVIDAERRRKATDADAIAQREAEAKRRADERAETEAAIAAVAAELGPILIALDKALDKAFMRSPQLPLGAVPPWVTRNVSVNELAGDAALFTALAKYIDQRLPGKRASAAFLANRFDRLASYAREAERRRIAATDRY